MNIIIFFSKALEGFFIIILVLPHSIVFYFLFDIFILLEFLTILRQLLGF
jgi:hypothetical protein